MNAGVFIMGVNEITFAHAPCKCMIFWKWIVPLYRVSPSLPNPAFL
jgi:hypothetical protein